MRVGHRRHGAGQLVGHTVGHTVVLVEVHHDVLVVHRLVLKPLGQFHVKQRRGARGLVFLAFLLVLLTLFGGQLFVIGTLVESVLLVALVSGQCQQDYSQHIV